MYKGIVLNVLLLKIVTDVRSPKLNTKTVVQTNINSNLILGKSILINLVKDVILKREMKLKMLQKVQFLSSIQKLQVML